MTNAERPLAAPLDRPLRLGVLISGGGTTLANLLTVIARGELRAEIPLVVASRPGCGGVSRAEAAGLRCEAISSRQYDGVETYSAALFERLRQAQVDLVVLGGFLSLIRIPDDFRLRVVNIHPSLIPAFSGRGFYGHHVHEAVLARGVKVSGCTVHFVDNEYDHGPIILQRCVPVQDDDTPETLATRVFTAECDAYPEALRLYATARLEVTARRVRVVEAT